MEGNARISVDIVSEGTKERPDRQREDNQGESQGPRRGSWEGRGCTETPAAASRPVLGPKAGRRRGRGAGQPATSPLPQYSGGGGERPVGRSPCDTKRSEPLRRRYSAGALPSRGAAPNAVAAERRPRVAGGPGGRPRILRSESARPGRAARERLSVARDLGAQDLRRLRRRARGGGGADDRPQGAEKRKIRTGYCKSAQGKTRASSGRASGRRRGCGGSVEDSHPQADRRAGDQGAGAA